jgi:hypothetical protein
MVLITLVHGLIVGPTPKPLSFFSLRSTLFNRKDFPVLYFPTKEIIPICLYSGFESICLASSVIIKSIFKLLV